MTGTLAIRLAEGFNTAFGGAAEIVARAPGRVNLIGEHTDYNDGFALPMAIGAETRVAARRRTGTGEVRVAALDMGEHDSFMPAEQIPHGGGWRDYVRGTLAILAGAGIAVPGLDLAIGGDIPKGTGLSSSASLEIAVATAVLAAAGRMVEPRQIALWAQQAENQFVGVQCGNLDHLASAGCVEGAALLIDCRSLDLTPVPLPAEAVVLIVQSGVERNLVEGEYNARRRECEAAAGELGVAALRDADAVMLEAARGRMSDLVFRRARHVISENARTLGAVAALAGGDLAALGDLMRQSHGSQRDDFGITVPHTDRLAGLLDAAIGGEGGARQTGGGFGGAVVAVLRRDRVETVRDRILAEYRTPAGKPPDVTVESAAAGATVIG